MACQPLVIRAVVAAAAAVAAVVAVEVVVVGAAEIKILYER